MGGVGLRANGVGFACMCILVLTGCAQKNITDLNKRLVSLERVSKKPPDATYVVDPPDSIQIQFMNEPDLSLVEQVRQDGIVTLPHVGETKVAGMSTKEIREKLEEMYAPYYQDPEFVVRVTAYRSKHIYLFGEVRGPGSRPYTGYQTVMDAIGGVGGVTTRAAAHRIKVVRGDPDEPETFRLNLWKLIRHGENRQEVSLAENDVIYVPPTHLAWVGYRINDLLFPFRSAISAVNTAENVGD